MREPPCRARARLIPAVRRGGYGGLVSTGACGQFRPCLPMSPKWVVGDATDAPHLPSTRSCRPPGLPVCAHRAPAGSSAAAAVVSLPLRLVAGTATFPLPPRLEDEPLLSSFPNHPQSAGSPGRAGRTVPGARGPRPCLAGGGGRYEPRPPVAAGGPPPQPPAWRGPALQPPDGNGQGCQAPASVGTTPTLDGRGGQSGSDLGPSVTPRRDLENGRLARSQGPPAPQFVFPASLPPRPCFALPHNQHPCAAARSGARPRRCCCCCASAPQTGASVRPAAVRPYLLGPPPQPVSPSFFPSPCTRSSAAAVPRGCVPVPTVCRWSGNPHRTLPPLSSVLRADIYRPRLALVPPPAPSAPSFSHRPRLSRGAPHAHLRRHGIAPDPPRTLGGQTTGIGRCHRMTRPASAAGGTGESPGGDRGGRGGHPRGVTPDMPPLVWTSATGGGDGGGGAGADAPAAAAVGGHPPPMEDDESLPAAGDDDSGADGEGRSNGWADGVDGGGRPSRGGSGSGGQPLSLRRGAFRKALKVASPPIPDEGPPVEDKALQTCVRLVGRWAGGLPHGVAGPIVEVSRPTVDVVWGCAGGGTVLDQCLVSVSNWLLFISWPFLLHVLSYRSCLWCFGCWLSCPFALPTNRLKTTWPPSSRRWMVPKPQPTAVTPLAVRTRRRHPHRLHRRRRRRQQRCRSSRPRAMAPGTEDSVEVVG